MDAVRDRERLERALSTFERSLRVACPALPARVREDLEAESAPLIGTLVAAGSGANTSERHEALALATLLGRRIATIGESPTTTLATYDAILDALEALAIETPAAALRAAIVEGFAAAVDERARTEMIARASQSLLPITVSARVVLLVIAGCEDADAVAQALVRLGRAALDADAKACLVHVSFPHEPDRDLLAEIAAFDGSAQMIGARAIFSGTPVALAALAAHAPSLATAASFEDALRRGLEAAEQEVRPASRLWRSLRRLRG